jgi:hypothetical protein
MQNINVNALQFYTTQNLEVPPEGPKAVALPALDFTVTNQYSLNMQSFQQNKQFSAVQAMFIDNSQNGSQLVIQVQGSPFALNVAPNRQAYLTILAPNPANILFSSNGAATSFVMLLNFPVVNHDWPAVTGA